MPDLTSPDYSEFEIDSSARELQNFSKQQELVQQQAAQNTAEAEAQKAGELKEAEDEFSDVGDVVRGVAETALQPVLGTADFVSDAVGLVPWLRPVDEWWDENSYRSTHPGHKLLRDASSLIVPTMVGGTAVVGSAKAATAAMKIPTYAKTLGSVAAWAGVDTGVAMISSHSKTDDNLAASLNDWLGWDIPWATRSSDSPDLRWKKNVFEAAGFAGGVELLGAAFTFGRKAKLIPRDAAADNAIKARQAKQASYSDPVAAAVEPRREARAAAQADEAKEVLIKDPWGDEGYNAFVNDIGEDSAGRAVNDLEADPLKAKLDQTLIQRNIDTTNGRMTSVADEPFQRRLFNAIDGDERAKALNDLFTAISPNFDAVVNRVKIPAEKINQSVDNLVQATFGKDISFKEFESLVDNMKSTVAGSFRLLDDEGFDVAAKALKQSFDKIFDGDNMRASAMMAQQAADNVADVSTAVLLLGEGADTTRQMQIMFKKLALLQDEVKINNFIMSKAQEYKKFASAGDDVGALDWLTKQSDEFDKFVAFTKAKTKESNSFWLKTAKENPEYFRAFSMLYDKTNGDIDQISKMHAWALEKIGLIRKGIFDRNPEIPSIVVQGMQTARINSILMGLAPGRAALGNATMITLKPISVFVGAKLAGDDAALKRAMYVYGGVSENIKRGYKVMQQEWHNAIKHPEEMGMRGRADLKQAKIEDMEILDAMADGWRANGENGKLAMYNIGRGLTWWNNQSFTKLGTAALYALDGFLNSFMASGTARAKAWDTVLQSTNGAIDYGKMNKMQRELYSQAFDANGVLTDAAAKNAASELALNLDNAVVQKLEAFLEHVPAAKGLFLFPRTGMNALELSWSYNPLSSLGPGITRARRVLDAVSAEDKIKVLKEHQLLDSGQDLDQAFQALKYEYIGRQIMGASVVTGVGILALEGSLTGNGPQDSGEKRRMMEMGWQPQSIRNPLTGQWHSYRGFEPFDKLFGMTADVVYQSTRVDQAVTEDFFRKLSYSISMNVTNSTFLSGMNPVAGLIAGDPGSWNRFLAQQTDQLVIPFRGIRSILNNAITPQLKDVENDYWAYMKNANKFLFPGNDNLKNLMDVYTGKPIKYFEPLTAAANSVLPTFKSNGGGEHWRQWLLSTGWDGLQTTRRNKITKEPLKPSERYFINNWIAKNADLKGQIISLMKEDDGYWNKQLRLYVKKRGLKSQSEYPIKQFFLHRELDRIHDEAFDAAWDALEATNFRFTDIGREKNYRDWQLRRGELGAAEQTTKEVKRLLNETRY